MSNESQIWAAKNVGVTTTARDLFVVYQNTARKRDDERSSGISDQWNAVSIISNLDGVESHSNECRILGLRGGLYI